MSAAREIRERKGELGVVLLLLVLLVLCAQTQIIRLFLLLLGPRQGERDTQTCGIVAGLTHLLYVTDHHITCSCGLVFNCFITVMSDSGDNVTSQIYPVYFRILLLW